MDIKPSGNEYTGSGNVILNVDGPKNIAVSIQTRVNKQSAVGNVLLEAGATCSKSKHESRSCCETIDKNGKKLCCLFKNKLQQFYESLTLPKVAWIDEGCDLSLVEHFAQLELDDSKKAIRIEDIFNLVNDKKPVRILIEGPPGFGKTTLATKLAYDWAKNEEYINFEFAFFIPLRELKQRSIKDAIFEIGKHCEYPDNEIEMMIQCHKEEILLIMDGLDEMTQKDRYEVLKILYKQSYSEMTVVVFSRTGLFALSKPERHRLFGQTSKKMISMKNGSTY
uniref:NACHT domain-containing protein n=1 Tax=Strigamia maritima TaxID=126957 RepID=T1JBX5_STRMM